MIKLSLKEKNEFVRSYIQNEIDLSLLNERTNDKFEKSILNDFEYLLELSDIKNLRKFYKLLSINKLKIEDLKERIIETKYGKVLIGIRHKGMDLSNPFVNIWANYSIEKNLQQIIQKAKNEFVIFKPKYVRFYVKPDSFLSNKYDKFKDQSYYVESLENISKKKLPLNYNNISIGKIYNLDFFDWYDTIFKEFHKTNPEFQYTIQANSKSDFESSIKDKLLYLIAYKGNTIGVLAGNIDYFAGKRSIYITEIIFEKEYKGKKFATAAQRKLIEENKKDFTYIWGKISKTNIPSSKNALRVGRKIVSTEIFLPLNKE